MKKFLDYIRPGMGWKTFWCWYIGPVRIAMFLIVLAIVIYQKGI